MDSLAHPDLVALGRVLRERMDRTLDAEMAAARAAARRRLSLRDHLLAAEDASRLVTIETVDGAIHAGMLEAVGTDHVELVLSGRSRIVAIDHITSIEDRY